MDQDFRFAIVSDLHIATPPTILNQEKRFHMVEISIPTLEKVLSELAVLPLDFLLIPGDLTQDGEPENHHWLQQRLSKLPFPVYVIPGNHDIIAPHSTDQHIGMADFPHYYRQFGYQNSGDRCYYACDILPNVQLIGLNSSQFDQDGNQLGYLDPEQLKWLENTLSMSQTKLNLVMVHHNIIDHFPGQSSHSLGRRYMLDNAPELLAILADGGVNLIFTGHLHIQDVSHHQQIYEITTGSLVSYPHPYRLCHYYEKNGEKWLEIDSVKIESLDQSPELATKSRQHLSDRSSRYMLRLLTEPPLNLSVDTAHTFIPDLYSFWANMADGDGVFKFPHFPEPIKSYFESFSTTDPIDNQAKIQLK
jgi:3',5'-cyclic AMP phosphodiesterase CpdA